MAERQKLNSEELKQGIVLFEKLIADLGEFDAKKNGEENTPELDTLRHKAKATVERVFNQNSSQLRNLRSYIRLAITPLRHTPFSVRDDSYVRRSGLSEKVETLISVLETNIEEMNDELKRSEENNVVDESEVTKNTGNSDSVFIVHGRDNSGLRHRVARFLTDVNLDPIILHEKPNQGFTIIEKFEENADVGFAVVMMTADDVGGLNEDTLTGRARQNVIFELGYFLGALGRERVCVLKAENLEMPSDIHGLAYIEFDEAGAWKLQLGKELKTAGYEIDLNSC